jgi:hypothetical protein
LIGLESVHPSLSQKNRWPITAAIVVEKFCAPEVHDALANQHVPLPERQQSSMSADQLTDLTKFETHLWKMADIQCGASCCGVPKRLSPFG